MNDPIRGGYILKARCFKNSAIAHAPPHVRDIWDHLLREAFWQDGRHLKRGELATSYREIREALHWKIGWRKESYTKSQCENAMKYLKKAGMVAARRTTGGFIVSICNYCRFQDPESYESHSERYRNATGEPHTPDTTDEEGYKKEAEKGSTPAPAEGFPHDLFKRFGAAHAACQRVNDFEFQRAVAACPGCDVAEAVGAFERQLAGAGSIRFPLREFEKYLRRSVGKKDGGQSFYQKNAAQLLADKEHQEAINARLLVRPEGEESQAERLKRLAEERERKRRLAAEQESEG